MAADSQSEKYLAMYLDAPMQSWGYMSRFDRRTTLSHPTRSGIIGMLCAAMGRDRSDVQILEQFQETGLDVYTYQMERRLVDFHTVGGGFDKSNYREKFCIVPKADGKPGSTVVTQREYLLGSRFGAVLSGHSEFIERAGSALKNPKWGIWLGRKSCIPATPIWQGVFDTDQEAVDRLLVCAKQSGCAGKVIRSVREVDRFDQGTDSLMDIPLDFSKRTFTQRRICVDTE